MKKKFKMIAGTSERDLILDHRSGQQIPPFFLDAVKGVKIMCLNKLRRALPILPNGIYIIQQMKNVFTYDLWAIYCYFILHLICSPGGGLGNVLLLKIIN